METAGQPIMDLAAAAKLLELPDSGAAVDDDMVITMYNLQTGDNPSARDKLHQALGVLAEARNSEMLRRFHATGEISSSPASGANPATTNNDMQGLDLGHPDLPAGLNNIGNTCYLNSVLQYFYAVRPLREKVIKASQDIGDSDAASAGSSRRVGGRAVTEYEVKRSKRFVRLLAQLFDAMMTSPLMAVSPERELAYLALVSARVEELEGLQQESPAEGTGSDWPQYSMENSVNLNDSGLLPSLESKRPPSPASPAPSITAPEESASVSVPPTPPEASTSANTTAEGPDSVGDVTMEAPEAINAETRAGLESRFSSATPEPIQPPPLPPRPPRVNALVESSTPSTAATGVRTPPLQRSRRNSLMTLGAQQDVSECLNNVLFQIEIALGPGSDTTSETPASKEPSTSLDDQQATAMQLQQQDPEIIEEQGNIAALFTGKTSQKVEPLLPGSDETANESLGPSPAPSPTQTFTPHRSQSTHIKNEIFSILPVDVFEEEGRDIYDGLDGFFEEETLESSDGSRVRRSVNLLEPPPILQIQLQRVQFDRVRGVAYKTQAHLEMGEELYMDRYMNFDPSRSEREARMAAKRKRAIAIRTEIREARERLAVLRGPSGAEAQRAAPGPSTSMCATSAKPPAPVSVAKTLALTSKSLRELANLPPIAIPPRAAEQGDGGSGEDAAAMDTQGGQSDAVSPQPQASQSTRGDDAEGPPPYPLPGPAESAEEEEVSCGFHTTDFSELITEDLCGFLEEEGRTVEVECRQLEERILALKREVEQIWTPAEGSDEGRQVAYRLMSVFMHRGEASHGHYFLNQRRVSDSATPPLEQQLAPAPAQEQSQPAALPLGESQQQQQTQGDPDVTMEAASQQLDPESFPSLQDAAKAGEKSQSPDESNKENAAPAQAGIGTSAPQPQAAPEVSPRPPTYTERDPFADPEAPSWFKYNDRDVTPVSLQNVLRDTTGATPYLLCYVRQDLQEQHLGAGPVFESLKRVVDLGGFAVDPPPPAPSPQDQAAMGSTDAAADMDTTADGGADAITSPQAATEEPSGTTLTEQIAAVKERQDRCGVPNDGISTPPLPPEYTWEGVDDDVAEVRLDAGTEEAFSAAARASADPVSADVQGQAGLLAEGREADRASESSPAGAQKDEQGGGKSVLKERNG